MKDKENDIMTNVPEKKGTRIVKAILNTIINILIVLVLIVSLVVATLALTSKANDGVATIFGYSFHTIQTSSMEGGSDEYEGGDYYPGDLVIGRATGANPNEVYEVGDIIVYSAQDDDNPDAVQMIAHRIVARDEENGTYYYTTKGDNNDIEDTDAHTAAQILSVCYDHDYHGTVIKNVGGALDYIRTPQGFFVVVLIPMIIFFLYEIIRVVMNTLNYKKARSEEEKENAEREKQEAVDAAVAAVLEAQKAAQAVPAEATAGEGEQLAVAPPTDVVSAEAPAKAAPEMSAEDYEEFKRFMAFKKAQETQQSAAPAEEQEAGSPEE